MFLESHARFCSSNNIYDRSKWVVHLQKSDFQEKVASRCSSKETCVFSRVESIEVSYPIKASKAMEEKDSAPGAGDGRHRQRHDTQCTTTCNRGCCQTHRFGGHRKAYALGDKKFQASLGDVYSDDWSSWKLSTWCAKMKGSFNIQENKQDEIGNTWKYSMEILHGTPGSYRELSS